MQTVGGAKNRSPLTSRTPGRVTRTSAASGQINESSGLHATLAVGVVGCCGLAAAFLHSAG
jgi:hypothetical protein